MKYSLLLCFSLIMLSSCAQKNKEQKTNTMNINLPHPEINAANFVDKISSQIKEYDEQPFYFVRVAQNYCRYEILVNGELVEKQYGLGVLASPIEINHAILKSGPQTITYRLYPIGTLLNEEYEDTDEEVNTLIDETDIKINIVVANKLKGSDYKFSKEELVLSHKSATKKDSNSFIGAGLPFYEHTFTFEAKVPYENRGWTDAQDLTRLDAEELERAVLNYYNQYKMLFENKDVDAIARIHYDEVLKNGIAQYSAKSDIQGVWDAHKESTQINEKNFQPIEGYKMEFYNNGKVVNLRHPVIDPIDARTRGKSALFYLYEEEGVTIAYYKGIYLYLPKGQPLDSLRLL